MTDLNTIFDLAVPGRCAEAQLVETDAGLDDLPAEQLRTTPAILPEVSELQVVRHYTNLSRKNFSIDTQFYPLGSCTMKYNPRGAHKAASLPGFQNRHPLAPVQASQGFLSCLYDLQEIPGRRYRHERGVTHSHGWRTGRICRGGNDPGLP